MAAGDRIAPMSLRSGAVREPTRSLDGSRCIPLCFEQRLSLHRISHFHRRPAEIEARAYERHERINFRRLQFEGRHPGRRYPRHDHIAYIVIGYRSAETGRAAGLRR